MNVTIDKNYTIAAQMDYCKKYIKELKANYTEQDIMNVIAPQLDELGYSEAYGMVINMSIQVWNGHIANGVLENNECDLQVNAYVTHGTKVVYIRVFTNEAFTLSDIVTPTIEVYGLIQD